MVLQDALVIGKACCSFSGPLENLDYLFRDGMRYWREAERRELRGACMRKPVYLCCWKK